MGETRVDLLHLLEDLRDAYPGSLEETILTEIVANSLDSGASEIVVWTDPVSRTLTVTDNGRGMSRQALSRYHDLAATSKRRGASIGFAGVGIKLGLLISEEVHTETRRVRSHLATSWRLTTKNRAPWRWIDPPGLQEGPGTTVRLYLANALSELLEPGYVETTILRQFPALLDRSFDEILSPHYPSGVRFEVNGRAVARSTSSPGRAPIAVRVGRQRKPSAMGYLLRGEDVAEDERGVAISTLGKVITRGWDWLGLAPADADRASGLLEVPALVEALTLNKADFVRTGTRGSVYHAYRKAIQEVVAAQLDEWGDPASAPAARPRRTRALERDLQSVLADLTDEYPILSTLVERTPGGQRKLPFGRGTEGAVAGVPLAAAPMSGEDADATARAPEAGEAATDEGTSDSEEATETESPEGPQPTHVATMDPLGPRGSRRPARFGLRVGFESRPEDPDLGVLRESTVWVNDAHPAYRRAAASRSEGYHVALAVAMTLSRLAVEPGEAHTFVTSFLAAWGAMGKNGR
jgi:hypothetical protein